MISAHYAAPAALPTGNREAHRRVQDAATTRCCSSTSRASPTGRASICTARRAALGRRSGAAGGYRALARRTAARGALAAGASATTRCMSSRRCAQTSPTGETGATATAGAAVGRADRLMRPHWRLKPMRTLVPLRDWTRPCGALQLHLASLPPLSLYVHLPWCLRKCPTATGSSHELAPDAVPCRALPIDAGGGSRGLAGAGLGPHRAACSSAAARRSVHAAGASTGCWRPARAPEGAGLRIRWRPAAPSSRRAFALNSALPASRGCRSACRASTTTSCALGRVRRRAGAGRGARRPPRPSTPSTST